MRKFLCVFLLVAVFVWPVTVSAASFRINVSIAKQDDGSTLGELWYNEKVVWRLAFSPDGAQPASTSSSAPTTVVTPDIVNGFFVFKVK
ncbi:hypothetical protein [Dendrosporobacter sp. 1207_IL3150]|uniref:hypothetical protein n=1 Tax=Dendrosporobacter sp. 1207_IL3150 TaxID=3084054 RepID=UPI002FD9873A